MPHFGDHFCLWSMEAPSGIYSFIPIPITPTLSWAATQKSLMCIHLFVSILIKDTVGFVCKLLFKQFFVNGFMLYILSVSVFTHSLKDLCTLLYVS